MKLWSTFLSLVWCLFIKSIPNMKHYVSNTLEQSITLPVWSFFNAIRQTLVLPSSRIYPINDWKINVQCKCYLYEINVAIHKMHSLQLGKVWKHWRCLGISITFKRKRKHLNMHVLLFHSTMIVLESFSVAQQWCIEQEVIPKNYKDW